MTKRLKREGAVSPSTLSDAQTKMTSGTFDQVPSSPADLVGEEGSSSRRRAPVRESFRPLEYIIFALITLLTFVLCVGIGSVGVPPRETLRIVWNAIVGSDSTGAVTSAATPIIISVRLPRVLCVALTGTALSICGAAMQGLLKNPLADGSTLGVSSGASLGAVVAIAFGLSIPSVPFVGTMVMAMIFAFLSIVVILTLAYRLDYSLSTNTIILIGVIYSMFVSSIMSLVITFAGERVKHIVFWTMGSLATPLHASASSGWNVGHLRWRYAALRTRTECLQSVKKMPGILALMSNV